MMNTVVMILLAMHLSACQGLICGEGHYWPKPRNFCNLCVKGTFMPEKRHNKTECYPCTNIRDVNTEIVIRECSIETDALIVCKPGSFRHRDVCKNCTVCEPGHEIKACRDQSDAECCLSSKYYVDINSDGYKVCKVRTHLCKQGQLFNVSSKSCASCQPGTYMVDKNHNNTACNSCQQLPENHEYDDYVARVCNVMLNSTSVGNCSDDLVRDTACFNCSDLLDLYKSCLDKDIHSVDQKRTGNVTDQMCTAPSVGTIEDVFHILQITGTVILLVLLASFMFKCVTARSKLLLRSMLSYLTDKQDTLVRCFFIITFSLAVCYLVTLFVKSEGSELSIFIHLLSFITALLTFLVIIIATLCILLLQHLLEKTKQSYEQPFIVDND